MRSKVRFLWLDLPRADLWVDLERIWVFFCCGNCSSAWWWRNNGELIHLFYILNLKKRKLSTLCRSANLGLYIYLVSIMEKEFGPWEEMSSPFLQSFQNLSTSKESKAIRIIVKFDFKIREILPEWNFIAPIRFHNIFFA